MSTLTATAAQRQALLDLQDLDTEIDRAKAALNRLRTDEEFAQAKKDAADLAEQLAAAEGARREADRDAAEASEKAAATRAHRDRTRNRLHAGGGSHKELEAMMHEAQTLEGLLAEHDQAAREAMQAADAAAGKVTAVQERKAAVEASGRARAAHLKQEGQRITEHGRSLAARRAEAAAGLPAEIVARYEKVRSRNGGIGAGRLEGNRSSASGTPLSPAELERLRALPEDALAECPETGALLVRV